MSEWITHDGDSIPKGWRFTVRTRSKAIGGPKANHYWQKEQWLWSGSERHASDIVAYTVHEEPKAEEPEEPPAPAVDTTDTRFRLCQAIRAVEIERGVRINVVRVVRSEYAGSMISIDVDCSLEAKAGTT
jgi:hypothetical protein